MILSIESSCDDSAISITEIATNKLLFHKKISQELEHSVYGGVVPELAARLHAEALPKILQECEFYFKDLKAVAVTSSPGLAVTLIKETTFPLSVLLVSGGHTQVMEVQSLTDIKTVAKSMDDSFGESFDKVAKMMGLGYPGGPAIQALAKEGERKAYDFTVPLLRTPKFAFSYSGLKNAVRLAVEKSEQKDYKDIAASFEHIATKHLTHKLKKYFQEHPPKNFAIVGGASAKLLLSDLQYCSDNAAMIGRVAVDMYKQGMFTSLEDLEMTPKSNI